MLWLPLKEAAARLQVDPNSVRRWCRSGRVEAYRPARTGPWRVAFDKAGRVVSR